jgi:hypothetical protein
MRRPESGPTAAAVRRRGVPAPDETVRTVDFADRRALRRPKRESQKSVAKPIGHVLEEERS